MSGEKVYLCGPINGCTDDEAVTWREVIKEAIGEENTIDPMRRDYRGMEDTEYASIVEGDKDDIEGCDIVLANCWQVSVGTSMEILFAYHLGVPVISVVPLDSKVSPWLRYHSKVVYSLEDALDEMAGVVYFPVGEEATSKILDNAWSDTFNVWQSIEVGEPREHAYFDLVDELRDLCLQIEHRRFP